MRQELASTREYLQSLIEQQDAATEELKSANEEILSSNEELQSTNEELETAKEELQSINEELTTVNEQLQHRNMELARLNDDMTNLLASSGVAKVVLGGDLRIRRFTPAAGRLLGLLAGDIGRPIAHLKVGVDLPDMEALVGEVIASVQPQEREVLGPDGRWYLLRIHPYRTTDNRIDGAVLVLFDIDELRHAQTDLRVERDYARAIVETVREPLIVLDGQLRVQSANSAFYAAFQVAPEDTEGRLLYDLGNRQWDIAGLREQLAGVLSRNVDFADFDVRHEFESIGLKVMRLAARRIAREDSSARADPARHRGPHRSGSPRRARPAAPGAAGRARPAQDSVPCAAGARAAQPAGADPQRTARARSRWRFPANVAAHARDHGAPGAPADKPRG